MESSKLLGSSYKSLSRLIVAGRSPTPKMKKMEFSCRELIFIFRRSVEAPKISTLFKDHLIQRTITETN